MPTAIDLDRLTAVLTEAGSQALSFFNTLAQRTVEVGRGLGGHGVTLGPSALPPTHRFVVG